MSYRLSASRVVELLSECLAGEDGRDGSRIVPGIVANYALDRVKLAAAKPEIAAMLLQLDDTFMSGYGKGGGWSFLQACNDRRGRQWADEHRSMEALFVLGLGVDLVDSLLPREMWEHMPGGMPYYSVREISCEEWSRRYKVAA